MRKLVCLLGILSVSTFGWPRVPTCSTYNISDFRDLFMASNVGHTTLVGDPVGHSLSTTYFRSCTYTASGGTNCNVNCNDNGRDHITTTETASTVTNIFYHHVVNYSAVTGGALGVGAGANCGSTVAVAATACLKTSSCIASVTISASSNGIGVSVTWPPQTIWPDSDIDNTICGVQTNPNPGSPIIIDLGGGYHLSLLKDGVPFNFFGDGKVQMSWPEEGANNGFLVLPDKDGMVSTGHQMFGNQDGYENGFLQLVQYDSNGDGKIDSQDGQIFSDLRVWVDRNHDGISQPGELHTLDELGIDSIGLRYSNSPYIDNNGNAFRYKGSMVLDSASGKDKKVTIYDVFLQVGSAVK